MAERVFVGWWPRPEGHRSSFPAATRHPAASQHRPEAVQAPLPNTGVFPALPPSLPCRQPAPRPRQTGHSSQLGSHRPAPARPVAPSSMTLMPGSGANQLGAGPQRGVPSPAAQPLGMGSNSPTSSHGPPRARSKGTPAFCMCQVRVLHGCRSEARARGGVAYAATAATPAAAIARAAPGPLPVKLADAPFPPTPSPTPGPWM